MSLENKPSWQIRFPATNKIAEKKGMEMQIGSNLGVVPVALCELATQLHDATETIIELENELRTLREELRRKKQL